MESVQTELDDACHAELNAVLSIAMLAQSLGQEGAGGSCHRVDSRESPSRGRREEFGSFGGVLDGSPQQSLKALAEGVV